MLSSTVISEDQGLPEYVQKLWEKKNKERKKPTTLGKIRLLNVLEIGPLRFSRVDLYETFPAEKTTFFRRKGLAKVTFFQVLSR